MSLSKKRVPFSKIDDEDYILKKIDELQKKYDENGYDLPHLIKLQRIEQHIDASLRMLSRSISQNREEARELDIETVYLQWYKLKSINTKTPTFQIWFKEQGYRVSSPPLEQKEFKSLEDITDDELIHIARLAHQSVNKNFKVVKRDEDSAHAEWRNPCGIIYHVSFRYKYATVNANMHFEATEKEQFSTSSVNIGEISVSSKRPVPYIAIYQYLQSKGYKLPKYY